MMKAHHSSPGVLGVADQILYAATAVVLGCLAFAMVCLVGHVGLPFLSSVVALSILLLFAVLVCLIGLRMRTTGGPPWYKGFPLFALIATASTMGFLTVGHFVPYLVIPADILSFSESIFVSDVIRIREGAPLYSPPQDNNSHPYTPGAQLLTYGIAAALGYGDNVVAYRLVQFSFVVLAAVVAALSCQLVTRLLLPDKWKDQQWMWLAAWLPMLFMVAVDARFNEYVHSLHNDGLALLISVCAFWLMAKHATTGNRGLLIVMSVVPALGFFVKQSLLIWGAVFVIYLVLAGGTKWRDIIVLCVAMTVAVLLIIAGCHYLWSDSFVFWVFQALGVKRISLLESISHFMDGGLYVLMGLFACWVVITKQPSREALALCACWFVLILVQAYTSGAAYRLNHMGPGVLIGSSLFFAAIAYFWDNSDPDRSAWLTHTQQMLGTFAIVLLLGGLGHLREPVHKWPADIRRYVAEIEREFEGHDPSKVLLDIGSWVYLKDGVIMKDRSSSVAIHAGINQSEINRDALAETIKRINDQVYDKILAREFDTADTAYDFQGRGTGVKGAIEKNYHEVGRIAEVQVGGTWWPSHLVKEIVVLERNADHASTTANDAPTRPVSNQDSDE